MLEIDSIKVSVVIPIYNVELYIERCVRSLMEQTLENLEFIFVNDFTQDKSADILKSVLKEYPARQQQIIVVKHEKNRGLAAARKTGLTYATGEYIIHCDSDDWVERDMYEKLLRKAVETNADIVGCDFYDDYIDYSIVRKQLFPIKSKECIIKMLRGDIYCSVWNKLINKTLYGRSKICFTEGINMWEDVSTIIPLCFYANKIAYISEPLYHYIHYNTSSYLACMSQTSLHNLIDALELVESFFKKQEVYPQYSESLCFMKLTVKLNLLLGSKDKQQVEWNKLYPEANAYIWKSTHISYYWKIGLQLAAFNLLLLFNIVAQLGKIIRSMKR